MREYFHNPRAYPTIAAGNSSAWLSRDGKCTTREQIPIPQVGGRAISLVQQHHAYLGTQTNIAVLTERGYVLVFNSGARRWCDIPLKFAAQFLTDTYIWGLQGQCYERLNNGVTRLTGTPIIFASKDLAIDADHRLVGVKDYWQPMVPLQEVYYPPANEELSTFHHTAEFTGVDAAGKIYIFPYRGGRLDEGAAEITTVGHKHKIQDGVLRWDRSSSVLPAGTTEIALNHLLWTGNACEPLVLTEEGELWILSHNKEPKMIGRR
jgi:hypothetical protein